MCCGVVVGCVGVLVGSLKGVLRCCDGVGCTGRELEECCGFWGGVGCTGREIEDSVVGAEVFWWGVLVFRKGA